MKKYDCTEWNIFFHLSIFPFIEWALYKFHDSTWIGWWKETKTLMLSYFHCKVLITKTNQWKFEQNDEVRDKEVTAFWNLAINRAIFNKLWTTSHDMFCTWNFLFSPIFLWLRQFLPEIKIWQARMYTMWYIMMSDHKDKWIRRKLHSNEILCKSASMDQVVHKFSTIWLSPSSGRYDFKKLKLSYSLPDFVQTFTDLSK